MRTPPPRIGRFCHRAAAPRPAGLSCLATPWMMTEDIGRTGDSHTATSSHAPPNHTPRGDRLADREAIEQVLARANLGFELSDPDLFAKRQRLE